MTHTPSTGIHSTAVPFEFYPDEMHMVLKAFNHLSTKEMDQDELNTYFTLLDLIQEFVLANS
jgi:hypothetical protein